jgi:hypothetical protein
LGGVASFGAAGGASPGASSGFAVLLVFFFAGPAFFFGFFAEAEALALTVGSAGAAIDTAGSGGTTMGGGAAAVADATGSGTVTVALPMRTPKPSNAAPATRKSTTRPLSVLFAQGGVEMGPDAVADAMAVSNASRSATSVGEIVGGGEATGGGGAISFGGGGADSTGNTIAIGIDGFDIRSTGMSGSLASWSFGGGGVDSTGTIIAIGSDGFDIRSTGMSGSLASVFVGAGSSTGGGDSTGASCAGAGEDTCASAAFGATSTGGEGSVSTASQPSSTACSVGLRPAGLPAAGSGFGVSASTSSLLRSTGSAVRRDTGAGSAAGGSTPMIVLVMASAIRDERLLGGTYVSGIERRGTGVVVALRGNAGAGIAAGGFDATAGGVVERVTTGFGTAGLGSGGFCQVGLAGAIFGAGSFGWELRIEGSPLCD